MNGCGQCRLKFLLLFLLIIAIGIGVGAWGLHIFNSTPTVAPDYPLPPEDTTASVIRNDNSVKETKTNYVSIKVDRQITLDLSSRNITMNYKNYNASNKDAVVTICVLKDDNEYAIARSGLIKAGREINSVKMLDDSIKLTQGVYNGRIKIDFYNEETGEKAATSSDFNDIEITVK